MLNLIVSGGALLDRFASSIACRSDPGPLSLVLVTNERLGIDLDRDRGDVRAFRAPRYPGR